jgi:hypothetical protein
VRRHAERDEHLVVDGRDTEHGFVGAPNTKALE